MARHTPPAAAATYTSDPDSPPVSAVGITSSSDAGHSRAVRANTLPDSQAPRAIGCVKSSGNSSASPCAALRPSSSEDSDRQ